MHCIHARLTNRRLPKRVVRMRGEGEGVDKAQARTPRGMGRNKSNKTKQNNGSNVATERYREHAQHTELGVQLPSSANSPASARHRLTDTQA